MTNHEQFTDFYKSLKQSVAKVVPEPIDRCDERIYILIVCEGEKTEPNYFNFLKSKMLNTIADTITIIGEGDNTINVVKKAIREKKRRQQNAVLPNYTEVWAVFDKDDFSKDRIQQTFQLAATHDIQCAFSNQAFELWYILHFQYLDADLHRKKYIKILSALLDSKYQKNSEDSVAEIWQKGSTNLAIKNAKRLEAFHKNKPPFDAVPYTSVYKLVVRLLEYGKIKMHE